MRVYNYIIYLNFRHCVRRIHIILDICPDRRTISDVPRNPPRRRIGGCGSGSRTIRIPGERGPSRTPPHDVPDHILRCGRDTIPTLRSDRPTRSDCLCASVSFYPSSDVSRASGPIRPWRCRRSSIFRDRNAICRGNRPRCPSPKRNPEGGRRSPFLLSGSFAFLAVHVLDLRGGPDPDQSTAVL